MRELINCIADYIKTGNNSGLKLFGDKIYLFMGFYEFIYFSRFSLIFINMQISRFTPLTTGSKTLV